MLAGQAMKLNIPLDRNGVALNMARFRERSFGQEEPRLSSLHFSRDFTLALQSLR